MPRTLALSAVIALSAILAACGQQAADIPAADNSQSSVDGSKSYFQQYDLADLPRLLQDNPVIREHFKHNPERLARLLKESEALRSGLTPQQTTPVSGINCYLEHHLDDERTTVWVVSQLSPCTVAFTSGSTYFAISGAGLSNSNLKSYRNAMESVLNVPLNNFPVYRPQVVCRNGSAEVTYAGKLYVSSLAPG